MEHIEEQNNIYKAIGAKIKEIRLKNNIGQKVLASSLKKSIVAISNYEKGIRQIGLNDLEIIARELGKPLSYFLGERATKSSSFDLLEKVNKFTQAIDKHLQSKKSSSSDLYRVITEQMCTLFDFPVVTVFTINPATGKLINNAYSIEYTIKRKIDVLTGLDLLVKDLKVDLKNKLATKLSRDKILFVNNQIELKLFIETAIPHLNLLTPILEKLFNNTNWMILLIAQNKNFIQVICINYGNRKLTDEEVKLFKLLSHYLKLLPPHK